MRKDSDQDGVRTHDFRFLIIVAPPTELQGQHWSKLWVLEILFHGREASMARKGTSDGYLFQGMKQWLGGSTMADVKQMMQHCE